MVQSRILNIDGCEFGRMVKKDLNFLVKKIDEGFSEIGTRLDKTDVKQIELFNHQSSRVPKEVSDRMNRLYAVLGMVIGGVLVGLIVFLLTR